MFLSPGADIHHDGEERGRSKLSPPLQLPKNRSTGNLAVAGDTPEKARMRFSFDAGAAAAEYDALTRLAWTTRCSASRAPCSLRLT
jgi:protein-serine/threonine kinase